MLSNYKKYSYILFTCFSIIFFLYVIKININNVMNNSGWFYLEQVDIKGLEYIDKKSVLDKLPFADTTNIFDLNFNSLRSKIEEDKRLKVVDIKTVFPNKLIIDLKEIYGDYIILLDEKEYFDVSKDMKVIGMNEDILNYDKMIFSLSSDFLKTVDIDLNKKFIRMRTKDKVEYNHKDMIENSFFLKRLINVSESFEGKDFFNRISVVYLNPKFYIEIFLRDKQQKILIDGQYDIKDLKKARYAYVYSGEMDRSFKMIDIRNDIVKYVF